MNSSEYYELENRIDELIEHLLPVDFEPTGTYHDKWHDRARAFRLLAHAELESFIENRATSIANASLDSYLSNGSVSSCLMGLLAFNTSHQSTPPTSIIRPPQKPSLTLEERLKGAKDAFNKYAIAANNGLKEENILRLLLPIGVPTDMIPEDWLHSINAWATGRGEYAHSATKVHVKCDPKSEWNKIRDILDGFRRIDEFLVDN